MRTWEKMFFSFFYKISRTKLKRENSLYQNVNSAYRSSWRMRWREIFHVLRTIIETQLLVSRSSRLKKLFYKNEYLTHG